MSVGELPPIRKTILVWHFRGEERSDLDLPRVMCEYVDVFPDELLDYLHIGM